MINCYNRLKEIFSDGIQNYEDPITGLTYDFYAPSESLYIDLKFDWKDQGHVYDANNKFDQLLECYLDNDSKFNWKTIIVAKVNVAKQYNMKYMIFWNEEEFEAFFNMTLYIQFSNDELHDEYKKIIKNDGRLSLYSPANKIVKQFQQENLYKHEQELFNDYWIRYKLCRNRDKYINKKMWDLTPNGMVNGFKIAGIHYGFSMFNPMLAKWFIQHYELQDKICYDPTGGWGHRLIGIAPFVKKYIYNDLSLHTVEACKEIGKFCNLNNIEYCNEDAATFCPDDNYNFMFTCPPYYADNKNTEDYECDGFNSLEEFNNFLIGMYEKFLNKDSCKYFGLVIREDMLPEQMRKDVKESYDIARNANSHYARVSKTERKKFYEKLYVFKK